MTNDDAFIASARRAERDAIRAAVGTCAGLNVLDAGSFRSELLPRFDDASLAVLRDTERSFSIPARSFDRAISAQVLPHMHGSDRRSAYLSEMARILKPEGRFVATTMHFSFRFRRKGAPKEGWEDNVYFNRYLPEEFRDELEPFFTVEQMHGFWIYLPKTYPLYMSLGSWSVYWERALRNLPLSLKYGKFLLALCRPKTRGTL
ncbi:MAG TPA: class I SAM-dependent methyltransferase [Candidatus Acidoferrales bacterium]|jgi:SAM-dependent methyltransferase|nr:class I SAM-dependent methyltransferase [Candidatus Acidoferrales bacterium]